MSLQNEERLVGVHADLEKVIRRAAELLPDLHVRVQEGRRTLERQRQLVTAGASRTMNSRHLTGHAADLLPVMDIDKDGKVEMEELYNWPLSFKVAAAVKKASAELNVAITWGGCWDRLLTELSDPEAGSAAYVARRVKAGFKGGFVDGPHFELNWKKYPCAG